MKDKKKYSVKDRALLIGKFALDKKADDVVMMKMSKIATMCDYFVICSGVTERKVQAIADSIREESKKQDLGLGHIEGYNEASWILLDYYDIVVHVFREDAKRFYDLEHLWAQAPKQEITEESVKKIRKKIQTTN